MSERGSFVTEYIYCDKCVAALKPLLCTDDKFLRGIQIPSWTGQSEDTLPILAGKVGGLHSGGELEVFDYELRDEIEAAICHAVRIAVLADSGASEVFTYEPTTKN